MYGIEFESLLERAYSEFTRDNSIFSIPSKYFYKYKNSHKYTSHGNFCSNPIGPAAGPHTQLAQNISALYLTGARIFELKTVQILDELEFPKPCIDTARECYNTEWSTELSIENAIDEYTKAFVLNYFFDIIFELTNTFLPSFIFDMSVGYDLKGIKSKKVDNFLNILSGKTKNKLLLKYVKIAKEKGNLIYSEKFNNFTFNVPNVVSSSVTLSTMHGCPPSEIEDICKYLMETKNLNTCLKLNPTLLGYDTVRELLDKKGYTDIEISYNHFQNDLKLDEAIDLVNRLKDFSKKVNREFSIKLTNTLPVKNTGGLLLGDEKYMSGKPLYLLTLSLAEIMSQRLKNVHFSFSGGVDETNAKTILECGIAPITIVTDLLKPDGLKKMFKLSEIANNIKKIEFPNNLEIKESIKKLFEENNFKVEKVVKKSKKNLPVFDCFKKKICGKCVDVCPNRANILIKVDDEGFNANYQILHFAENCNECGNCGVFCPYEGLPYKDKITFYSLKKEFDSELNNGFFIEKMLNDNNIILRLNRRKYFLNFNKQGEFLTMTSNCRKEVPDDDLGDYIIFIEKFLINYREYYEQKNG